MENSTLWVRNQAPKIPGTQVSVNGLGSAYPWFVALCTTQGKSLPVRTARLRLPETDPLRYPETFAPCWLAH